MPNPPTNPFVRCTSIHNSRSTPPSWIPGALPSHANISNQIQHSVILHLWASHHAHNQIHLPPKIPRPINVRKNITRSCTISQKSDNLVAQEASFMYMVWIGWKIDWIIHRLSSSSPKFRKFLRNLIVIVLVVFVLC